MQSGKGFQRVLDWLLADNLRAASSVAALSLLYCLFHAVFLLASLLFVGVLMLLSLITFARGANAGLFALFATLLPLVLPAGQGAPQLSLLAFSSVTYISACLLSAFRSYRLVLEVWTMLALFAIFFSNMMYPGWYQTLTQEFTQHFRSIYATLPEEQLAQLISSFLVVFPYYLYTSITLQLLLSILLARCLFLSRKNKGLCRREFYALRQGMVITAIGAVLCVASFLGVAVPMLAKAVVLVPFVVAGLALFHHWVHCRVTHTRRVLIVFYFSLLIPYLFPFVFFALMLVGFLDVLLDFRRRYDMVLPASDVVY